MSRIGEADQPTDDGNVRGPVRSGMRSTFGEMSALPEKTVRAMARARHEHDDCEWDFDNGSYEFFISQYTNASEIELAAAIAEGGVVLTAPDGELRAVYVCDLCGQPLAAGERCASGTHDGPDDRRPRGRAVLSTEIAEQLVALREAAQHLVSALGAGDGTGALEPAVARDREQAISAVLSQLLARR